MTLQNLLRAIRRGWWILVTLVVLGGAAGAGVALVTTPAYEASARLFVGFDTAPNATPAELVQANNFAIQKVYSYQQVVTSPRVLEQVVTDLGLDETAADLARSVTVSVPTNSAIIEITAEAGTPEDAVALTEAVTAAFTATVVELETPTAGGTAPVRIETLETPSAPSNPATPNVLLDIALGLFVGLVVGLVVVGVLAAVDRRIRRSDDISESFATPIAPVVAGVPRYRQSDALTVLRTRPGSRAAEAYRTIASSIGHGAQSMPRVMVVAPCKPPESGSALTLNLAMAFVEYGANVVVVDANVRTGTISSGLGIQDRPGLGEAIGGQSLDQLIVSSEELGLSILPAGTFPGNPASSFATTHFGRTLRDLRGVFDLVIVDGAPITPLSDARAITRASDATVLSMSAGRLTDADLAAALEALNSVGADVIAAVVTDARVSGPDADSTVAPFRSLHT